MRCPRLTGETLDGRGIDESVETSEARDTEIQQEPEKTEPDTIEVEGVKMTFEKPQDTQLDLF